MDRYESLDREVKEAYLKAGGWQGKEEVILTLVKQCVRSAGVNAQHPTTYVKRLKETHRHLFWPEHHEIDLAATELGLVDRNFALNLYSEEVSEKGAPPLKAFLAGLRSAHPQLFFGQLTPERAPSLPPGGGYPGENSTAVDRMTGTEFAAYKERYTAAQSPRVGGPSGVNADRMTSKEFEEYLATRYGSPKSGMGIG